MFYKMIVSYDKVKFFVQLLKDVCKDRIFWIYEIYFDVHEYFDWGISKDPHLWSFYKLHWAAQSYNIDKDQIFHPLKIYPYLFIQDCAF